MESESKRTIWGYEITHSVELGYREVVMGQNRDAPEGERYMCALCRPCNGLVHYDEVVASDDFTEIVTVFVMHINDQNQEMRSVRDLLANQHIDPKPFTAKDCRPDSWTEDIEGKIVVIEAGTLRPEFQLPIYQLMLCTGGFGAKASARGTTVYGVDIYSGARASCKRSDVLGTMERDALPDWAKNGLAQIERNQAEKQRGER